MHSLRSLSVVLSLFAAPVLAETPKPAPQAQTSEAERPRCEHGVQKTLCARCNPKLAPVFKAKKDWCPEHARPESQCVLCNPELAEKGVK
ncbi:putative Co/Zn/Cd efflux system membrane fusion protein [Myxococcus hansupus]|uniref:Putative Co/Zn/Cd efflux system membrane fusion protein n=1 Tax=Pseudomyxococcus hansupus TaxID=1297742 RepID=A0A0H4XE61_9BACT|nr:hypothetical protein [Myxococcus hansupus]AKQ66367.1 putative Co/Zn/Cd efflux system membrane fusion protein [Myxococcus hansupus]